MGTKIIENYHYLESGLEYVYIKKVKAINTPYGAAVNISNVKELHEKIAISILKNNIPLRGKELKFLRKTSGITQVDLSDLLNVGQSTVANWEGKEIDQTIDPSHAYFLQQFFREKYGLSIVGPSAIVAKKDSRVEVFKIAV